MIVKYFDKDGKKHQFNINRPIFICSEAGGAGDYYEIKIEERIGLNEHNKYEPTGSFKFSPANRTTRPIGIVAGEYGNELIIGPVKQI